MSKSNPHQTNPKRIVIAITGASGAILGIRLVETLKAMEIETHLILSQAAHETIQLETPWNANKVKSLADRVYENTQISAAIASGSFKTEGMVVIPCSIKTLSGIANSYASNLIVRAADVALKEGRPLILVVREAPLHRGHLRLMSLAAEAGAVIFPPIPAFYDHPADLNEIIDNLIGRILARLGIPNNLYHTWEGDDFQ